MKFIDELFSKEKENFDENRFLMDLKAENEEIGKYDIEVKNQINDILS